MSRVSRFDWFLLLLVVAVCTRATATQRMQVDWPAMRDVTGGPVVVAEANWKVVCFLGTECPLVRLYSSRLQQLDEHFADRGVRVLGINSNPQDSPDDIKRFCQEHRISFPIIKDAMQSLARQFGATRTPEVFVLDADGNVRYQGRIDDQYEPGTSRAEPTRHDLRDAINSLIAGDQVAHPRTTAVGCLITLLERTREPSNPASRVTFTRDVAPILNQHCVQCHRQGEIGPFALTDYEEVIGWGEMILEVVEQQRMPPWHADPRFGSFLGERRMPEQARHTLAAWVAQDMQLGDPNDLPPQPTWPQGWHLTTPPDIELSMRERPFMVPPEGTVEYQYFVVDPKWEEDRWVRAAQVVPGNASVVHHAIVFVRPPDGSDTDGIGWMGGYVPGQRTTPLPPGHARRVPARSKLVFQMHYTPNGRATRDMTKVGVWFSDPGKVTHEVTTRVALDHGFEIPPGVQDYVVNMTLDDFERDAQLLSLTPHMHLRGKSFQLDVHRRNKRETLLLVPRYDFNWQHWYQLATPLPLENVDSLRMQVGFDNSAGNPTNPDPGQYVTWGDQTWQEMAVAFFDISHPRGKPRIRTRQLTSQNPHDDERRQRRIADHVDKFMSRLDRNGDGVVLREETPDAFRRFGFREIDRNRDGRLERDEIEMAAARRL